MRILVSDYSGHPFQVQLSRELARRGNEVTHVYFSEFQTPRGELVKRADDPTAFNVRPVSIGQPFAKRTFLRRRGQEIRVGRKIAQVIEASKPEVVLSANAPLDTQRCILTAAESIGARFYFWLQDIYSVAITAVLEKKFGAVGRVIGQRYRQLEVNMLHRSDGIVAISQDFLGFLADHGVGTRATVVENWAPLSSMRHSASEPGRAPGSKFRFLYSGTLGYKHDPELLLQLAEKHGAEVHVHTEGPAAEYLHREGRQRGVSELVRVAGWVPFKDLPRTLAQADALVAMVGTEAGFYSVPSKVLSYLCVGRPLLLSVPRENLAARLVEREKAGLVATPERRDEFLAHAARLMASPALCQDLGRNALAYAERAFDIERIGENFERILSAPRVTVTANVPWLGLRSRIPAVAASAR